MLATRRRGYNDENGSTSKLETRPEQCLATLCAQSDKPQYTGLERSELQATARTVSGSESPLRAVSAAAVRVPGRGRRDLHNSIVPACGRIKCNHVLCVHTHKQNQDSSHRPHSAWTVRPSYKILTRRQNEDEDPRPASANVGGGDRKSVVRKDGGDGYYTSDRRPSSSLSAQHTASPEVGVEGGRLGPYFPSSASSFQNPPHSAFAPLWIVEALNTPQSRSPKSRAPNISLSGTNSLTANVL